MTDQHPVVQFADVAAVLIGYLNTSYPQYNSTAHAYPRIPTTRPDLFTTIRRGGGPKRDRVTDLAQINVESWGPDEDTAHDLAQLNRGLLNAAACTVTGGTTLYTVNEFSGPQALPDPTSDQARYVQTFEVANRGSYLAAST